MVKYEHPLSWQALGRILTVGLLIFLAWKMIGIFVTVLVAVILAVSIYPMVKKVNRKLPLVLSILLVFLAFIIPFALFCIFVMPDLFRQMPELLGTLRPLVSQFGFFPDSLKNFDFASYLSTHTADLFASAQTAFYVIIASIEILVLMFYFILDHDRLVKLFLKLFPQNERKKIHGVLAELAEVNGQYIRGNLFISLICIIVVFIGFSLLRIPYALPLAILAGIMDLLPLVGSAIGAIPALIIAFSISPLSGFSVLVLHIAYQQSENAIISPLVYKKALSLYPALSFLAVIIGAELYGIVGAFLALPLAASIPVLVEYAHGYSKRHN
ncbi:MAG: AI-2E family transporter [Candidatus Moranbacteria bacterium]|nr:AI-2E family transporter [Candidatus Moranbacteria bacterium]